MSFVFAHEGIKNPFGVLTSLDPVPVPQRKQKAKENKRPFVFFVNHSAGKAHP